MAANAARQTTQQRLRKEVQLMLVRLIVLNSSTALVLLAYAIVGANVPYWLGPLFFGLGLITCSLVYRFFASRLQRRHRDVFFSLEQLVTSILIAFAMAWIAPETSIYMLSTLYVIMAYGTRQLNFIGLCLVIAYAGILMFLFVSRIGIVLPPMETLAQKTVVTASLLWLLFVTSLMGLDNNLMHRKLKKSRNSLREAVDELTEKDAALARHRDTLEQEVELRTHELSEAKVLAEEANRAKSQFLANMSHEIRTPLNGILGIGEILLMDGLPEEQQSLVNIQHESATSLLRLVNDILDLSKVQAGEMNIHVEPFSLHQTLKSTIDLYSHVARDKTVSLALQWPDHAASNVVGDQGRIEQILRNLVNNALKFTDEGAVTIAVEAPHNDDVWRITVRDTGIGIPADKLDAVFDTFSQADNSDTRRYGGTGLGLAICRTLAGVMNATLTVKSEHGIGSEFTLAIPLPSAVDGETATIAPARVVFVTSDSVLGMRLGVIVRRFGLLPLVVDSFADASACARVESVHALIACVDSQGQPSLDSVDIAALTALQPHCQFATLQLTDGESQSLSPPWQTVSADGLGDWLTASLEANDALQAVSR
ncbi:MAG: ATP-binding protein [Pseudomonadota bacterium]